MVRRVIVALFVLVLIADVRTQFFDFFQGYQPVISYQNSRPTTRHHTYDITTKRPTKTTTRRYDEKYEQSTRKTQAISYIFDETDRDDNTRQATKERQHKRKQSTTFPVYNLNLYSTTVKPARKTTKTSSSQSNNSHSRSSGEITRTTKPKNSRITNNERLVEYETDNPQEWYEKPIVNNIADDYYTSRPNYETSTRANYNNYVSNNYDNRPLNYNSYTTKNPFYNRPGVKPAVVENRPPITNRPVTKRPSYIVNSRPTAPGSISFPDDDESPEIISGPDEDYMSDAEKRRYVDLAERMCDKYKSLNTKQLQAIPLIPSPEPVQVNVSSCAPTNVPLVVGGKVVSIREFPHMALLGWKKLEGGGYSWKCGGSLVSDQYVLTAAHCAYQERDNTVVSGAPRVAQLGSSFLDDPGALVVKVAAVIRHPKYKASRSYYDIALLKLASPVTFSEVVKPACLGVAPPVGKPVVATGWGQTRAGGEQSQELRSVSLPIWDLQACARILGTSRKMPSGVSAASQMCAGEPRGGKDTCQGDSGGPAQIQDGCQWRVVAVTSVGRSCAAPNTPGLYALVQHAFVASQVFGGLRNNNNNHNNNVRPVNGQGNRNADSNGQRNRDTDYNYHQNDNTRSVSGQGNTNADYNNQQNNPRSVGSQGNKNTDYYNDHSRSASGQGITDSDSQQNNPRSVGDQGTLNTDYNYHQNDNARSVSSQGNRNADYNNQQNNPRSIGSQENRNTDNYHLNDNTRSVASRGNKNNGNHNQQNDNTRSVSSQGNRNADYNNEQNNPRSAGSQGDKNTDFNNQQRRTDSQTNWNRRTDYNNDRTNNNYDNQQTNYDSSNRNRNDNYRTQEQQTDYRNSNQQPNDYRNHYNNHDSDDGYIDPSRIWWV